MAVNNQQIATIALILIVSVLVPAHCKGFDASGEQDDGKREYTHTQHIHRFKQGN